MMQLGPDTRGVGDGAESSRSLGEAPRSTVGKIPERRSQSSDSPSTGAASSDRACGRQPKADPITSIHQTVLREGLGFVVDGHPSGTDCRALSR
jgi:hypothetical protein